MEVLGYGFKDGLMISDFDGFMPKNNPIVNFASEWDPEQAKLDKKEQRKREAREAKAEKLAMEAEIEKEAQEAWEA